MIQYNSLNVKLSNSQLNKLKFAMKNGTNVILRLSSKIQVANIRKALANHTLTDIKLLKVQLTKTQKGGF